MFVHKETARSSDRAVSLPIGLDIALVALGLGSGVRAGNQTQHAINGNDGRCAVADEGQGQTDNGHNADAHAHIDHHLEDQRRSSTEADQTAGIVGGLDGHIDAAANNGQLQQQDQHAAEEAQLLTDGGEDVVRMLGEEVAALGTVAVEQALAGKAAAGKGLEVDLGVVTFVDTLGVNGGVEQNQNAVSLIITQELPQNGKHGSHTANGKGKPPEADTAGKGHADEDEHENQRNAHVRGQSQVQTDQSAQMKAHVNDREGVGDGILVGRHDRCHDDNIGDFADLRKMVDWANKTNLSVIQLLPINDTSANMSWRDSYPYNCISTLALHPIYISLKETGELKDTRLAEEIDKQSKILNGKEAVDYDGVITLKLKFLKAFFEQEKQTLLRKRGFKSFVKENRQWLEAYAAFCVLRDKFKSANFRNWGEWAVYSAELVERVKKEFADEFNFYGFVQWVADSQMQKAKAYAHKKGVALKGDIPIGICRDSVEAWQYPHLFNFGQQAGAPPDAFSQDGQNWGFPTYNWEEMAKDNYAWWKHRFTHFAKYFDAYRIDHILGFFRIWEIPIEHRSGLMGHFYPAIPLTKEEIENWGIKGVDYYALFIEDPYEADKYHPMIGGRNTEQYKWLPWGQDECYNRLSDYYFYHRHNDFWYRNAVKKLQQLIASTNMLACGEDLGMLNESVERCMRNLKILSLELMIMPKQFGVKYGNPQQYPYLSVCTTSTHDCETLRMWLAKDKQDGSTDVCGDECRRVIEENLKASSMFVILPLQDWLAMDEQLRAKNPNDEYILGIGKMLYAENPARPIGKNITHIFFKS